MPDTKMLQLLLDGQSKIREDIQKLDKKLSDKIDKVDKRVDKLGKTLAILDEDAPTGEDFKNLEKRVKKLEVKIVGA